MHQFFEDYVQRLQDLIADFETAIADVPQEGLDWSPGADMNSLCVLCFHTAEATRYWVGVAIQQPTQRDRPAEFQKRGLGERDLVAGFQHTLVYVRDALTKVNFEQFDRVVESPLHGSTSSGDVTFTTGWALLHALEHAAIHVGHAQITRQLWDQRTA